MTSRIIIHPSIVDSTTNHPVLLIDASLEQIEDIVVFCKISNNNFDIYVYNDKYDDLPWLSEVTDRVAKILIDANSKVTTNIADVYIFGNNQEVIHPIAYFNEYDNLHLT